jgi:hypothetical protein
VSHPEPTLAEVVLAQAGLAQGLQQVLAQVLAQVLVLVALVLVALVLVALVLVALVLVALVLQQAGLLKSGTRADAFPVVGYHARCDPCGRWLNPFPACHLHAPERASPSLRLECSASCSKPPVAALANRRFGC